MNANANVSPSASFYRFAAFCCVYYMTAQLIQEISFHFGINDSATGEAGILQRVTSLDQFRLVLILLGFSFLPIMAAFAGVAFRRYQVRPAASVLGFVFSLLFVGAEVSARSIDLFLVSRKWAVEYQMAASELVKHEIAARIQTWDESVGAFYFALLGAHLLSSLCFSIATWDRNDKWQQAVALGFILSAIESAGRLGEAFLGQTWLSSLDAAYFPVVVLSFGTLAAWLWRQAQIVREESTASG